MLKAGTEKLDVEKMFIQEKRDEADSLPSAAEIGKGEMTLERVTREREHHDQQKSMFAEIYEFKIELKSVKKDESSQEGANETSGCHSCPGYVTATTARDPTASDHP